MVRWYDPGQLLRTGVKTAISTVFGSHADRRVLDALASEADRTFDYRLDQDGRPRPEIWLDYVADTGDGWNPTYTVASHLACPKISLTDGKGKSHELPRGEILVLGGDQVYPSASRKQYEERFIGPFETALPRTDPPHPHLFAIPGNHDWLDSLVTFSALFCQNRWIGGWRTQQDRSYFAARLPGHWWLLGMDIQLRADIDAPQLAYFRSVARQLEDDDRLILCISEPYWALEESSGGLSLEALRNNIRFLEEKVFRRAISVFLAGDWHHYRRHEDQEHRQKIIAGGGGAALHPTHLVSEEPLEGGYALKSTFPSRAASKRLGWRVLGFARNNPTFGFIFSFLYLFWAWSAASHLLNAVANASTDGERLSAASILFEGFVQSPFSLFLGLAITGLLVLFSLGQSKLFATTVGLLHGLLHITASLVLGWAGVALLSPLAGTSILSQVAVGGVLVAGGWLLGPLIFALYLLLSMSVFGFHGLELYSSLRNEDWKCFLRLAVKEDGSLTIFPVGFRRVARHWKSEDQETGGPRLVPDGIPDGKARLYEPALIEDPIRIPGSGARTADR